MALEYPNLGSRILDAARMATAMHVQMAVRDMINSRQQATIGGADQSQLTEESLLEAVDRPRRSTLNADKEAA